jgi:histidine ammonia-lyase
MSNVITNRLQLNQINSVLFKNEKRNIDQVSLDNVKASFDFLQNFSERKLIYGINTGFGPMAQYRISDDLREQLQYNLIRSHCTGTGALLPELYIKAIMLARLSTFLQGYSGVHADVVNILAQFINNDIYPLIFEHGSVGASGDLVQLAHLALCLIGEGEVKYKNKIYPTGQILNQLGIRPIQMYIREGLALTNGTSAMTGIGFVNLIYAKKLLNWAIIASCMLNEITASFDDYFSAELNSAKLHTGQQLIAAKMRNVLTNTKRIRKRDEFFYKQRTEEEYITDKVQEYYSLRCVPQILGPVSDTIDYVEIVLTNEIN